MAESHKTTDVPTAGEPTTVCRPSVKIYCDYAAELSLIGWLSAESLVAAARLVSRLHSRPEIRRLLVSIDSRGGVLLPQPLLQRLFAWRVDSSRELLVHCRAAVGPGYWLAACGNQVAMSRETRIGLGVVRGGDAGDEIPTRFWEAVTELRAGASTQNIGSRLLSCEEAEVRHLVDAIVAYPVAKSLLLEERKL